MPAFAYRAYLDDGRTEKGKLNAKTRDEAVRTLASQGRKPYFVAVVEGGAPSKGVPLGRGFGASKAVNLGQLFAELSVLLNAGFSVDRALTIVVAGEVNKSRRSQLQAVLDLITGGCSVSDAFDSMQLVAPDAVALLASGERSGAMAQICQRLANNYETRAKRYKAILDALTYPAFLLLTMCAALIVLATVLAPALEPIFEENANGMPSTLVILISIRKLFSSYPFVFPLCALIVLFLWLMFSRSQRARDRCFTAILALPVIGPLIKSAVTARYLDTLGLLIGNGVPMNESLRLAAGATNKSLLRKYFLAIEDAVANGERLHHAIEQTGLFDGATKSLVAIGEDANTLPLVLSRAAGVIETALDRRVDKSIKLLTPVLTITLGLLVGSLVISVMTTILSINDMALK